MYDRPFTLKERLVFWNKTRTEYGITYDNELIKLINQSRKMGFTVNSVVVTLYKNQVSVDKFIKRLSES